MTMKHNLKELQKLDPFIHSGDVRRYLKALIEELKQLKQEREHIIAKYPKDTLGKASSYVMIELINDLLGEKQVTA